jgi:hypothetical protein
VLPPFSGLNRAAKSAEPKRSSERLVLPSSSFLAPVPPAAFPRSERPVGPPSPSPAPASQVSAAPETLVLPRLGPVLPPWDIVMSPRSQPAPGRQLEDRSRVRPRISNLSSPAPSGGKVFVPVVLETPFLDALRITMPAASAVRVAAKSATATLSSTERSAGPSTSSSARPF